MYYIAWLWFTVYSYGLQFMVMANGYVYDIRLWFVVMAYGLWCKVMVQVFAHGYVLWL